MANTGRYTYCPMAGKIRGNRRTLRRWLAARMKRKTPDVFPISNCYPACYPAGYKK